MRVDCISEFSSTLVFSDSFYGLLYVFLLLLRLIVQHISCCVFLDTRTDYENKLFSVSSSQSPS
ncbi:Uncharacterised protein [Porphyromonas crevioricanis]|uniref:Uncharacterized protein n=1 Tax=Porphyromonas crevioricanis TaxID=393921 RepID=A0A2X4PHA2_9PORP|nr:Uncharacterised protein [Porphyromonas crevioricanis]